LKHLEDSNKHIIEEIVHQVGHLSELYEDAWSEKYKIYTFLPELLISGEKSYFIAVDPNKIILSLRL